MKCFANLKKYFASFALIAIIFPFVAYAQGESAKFELADQFQILPNCEEKVTDSGTGQQYKWTGTGACDWVDFLELIRNIVRFMLGLALLLSVFGIAYAGFLYVTAFGNSGQIEKAHGVFSKIAIGMFFVFCGWLLTATILKTLGVQDSFSLLNTRNVVPLESSRGGSLEQLGPR